MLICIDNVLTPDELKSLQSLMYRAEWVSGKVTAGTQAAQVKNNLQISEQSPDLATMRKMVLDALMRHPQFFTAALPLQILPPFFNCYRAEEQGSYGWHTDCAMRRVNSGYVRSDVSATLFLSDPEEYDGGVLTINDTFGQHGVKLKAGSVVVYPSSSIHQVSAVTRGARYACFMFLQSMVRDTEKRRLLYDMDLSLSDLRQSQGETEAVVNLTGCYHNLLRMWAER